MEVVEGNLWAITMRVGLLVCEDVGEELLGVNTLDRLLLGKLLFIVIAFVVMFQRFDMSCVKPK